MPSSERAPSACAASSTIGSPWTRSDATFALCPKRCTGTIAFVRSVIAAPTSVGSRLKLPSSMSTKTGLAPRRAMHPPVAKKENGVVITSSPGPTSSAMSATSSASVPLETPIACGVPT